MEILFNLVSPLIKGDKNMKIIKFDCDCKNDLTYSCNKPGDNSGEYVSLYIAQAMKSLIINLHASLRAINTDPIIKRTDELRKLLKI